MTIPKPDARLLSAASFVRQGAYLADIGCDHAYLPLYLCKTGKITSALACDIAKGPCERAKHNIAMAGMSEKIDVVQTNGLAGLDQKGVTDISICGMGGELIASIISDAPFVKDPSIRLILLPMSRIAHLRTYLLQNGFGIEDECLSEVDEKIYTCLSVTYQGTPRRITPFEAEFGMIAPKKQPLSPLFIKQLETKQKALLRRREGLSLSGQSTEAEDVLMLEIARYLS